MRLAIFSPLPPQRSGIATYTAELLPILAGRHDIDLYVDCLPPRVPPGAAHVYDAHDFVWRQARNAYDLIVYQLGNAVCHDYMWPYLTRYPGLVVLHDGHVHHSRARALLSRRRLDAYRTEFAFSHPDTPNAVTELGIRGLLGSLTYFWPMLHVPVRAARGVAVHNHWFARQLQDAFPAANVDAIRMGVADPLSNEDATRVVLRSELGFTNETVVFAAYGGITPEKRIPQIMRALAAVVSQVPAARLLLVGNEADHYDAKTDARTFGVGDHVTFAGYVDDVEFPQYLAAADVCLCLRWPSTGETSASMLRCLGARKPVIVTDLANGCDLPMLVTPWAWTLSHPGPWGDGTGQPKPIGVAIDIVDEDHSLKIAMQRLAENTSLRRQLGEQARLYWQANHCLQHMATDYDRLVQCVARRPPVTPVLPPHVLENGTRQAQNLLIPFGITSDVLDCRRSG